MKATLRAELPALLLLALMVATSVVAWFLMPARVPVHYGLDLQPDRWGHKAELLVGLPVMTWFVLLLMSALPRLSPGTGNAGVYRTARTAVVALFAVLHVAICVTTIRGTGPNIAPILLPAVGVLFIVLGNLMGKVRPNWIMGVRTPWTLSSKKAWIRANRLGGWVMIAFGFLLILAGAVRSPWILWVAIGLFTVAIVWLIVDSYFTWRSDPDKIPPAGTTPAPEA